MFLIRNFQRIEKAEEIASEIKSLIEDGEEMDLVAMVNAGKTSKEITAAFPETRYVLFKGSICELNGFKHPGGQFILEKANGKDINKYIYGASAIEDVQGSRHVHTEYVKKFLQSRSIGIRRNIADIQTQEWFQREVHQVSKELFKFVFTNSSFSISTNPIDIATYLGRHWLVTSNGVTRPYTVVLSQLQCNVEFRSKLL